MILSESTNEVIRSGDIRETTFTIQASGTAFRVLSDGLYANKIEAIVRELCCNAVDAQVSAGKGHIPFTIHLPTMAEPYFSIQDCGIGLTEFEACGGYVERTVPAGSLNPDGSLVAQDYVVKEYVGGIFNTFFKSTKTNSNEQIGALGLGSKSPLCYVDAFTVESVKNGRKLCFSVHFNEANEPAITTLDDHESDEPTGVKITLPVAAKDHYEFTKASQKVLEWFEVKPKINDPHFVANNREYLTREKAWGMGKNFRSYGDRAIAVMGKIAYPIDITNQELGCHDHIQALVSTPLVMFFDNGSLDFAASREALSYTPKTIRALIDRFGQVRDELPNSLQVEIDKCQTIWEAKAKWRDAVMQSALKSLSHIIKVTYKGERIKNSIIEIPYSNISNCVYTYFTNRGRRTTRNFVHERNSNGCEAIQVVENPAIYINDLPKGAYTRAQKFAKATNQGISIYSFSNEGDRKFFEDAIEGCEIKYTSDLPAPERAARAKGSKLPGEKMEAQILTSGMVGDKFTRIREIPDSSVGGFYLPVSRGSALDEHGGKIKNVREIMNAASELGFVVSNWEVHGFLPSKIARLKKTGPWVNVMDHIKEQLDNLIDNGDISFLEKSAGDSWVSSNAYFVSFARRLPMESLPEDHILRKFVGGLTTDSNSVMKSHWFNSLIGNLNVKRPAVVPIRDLQSEYTTLLKKYPLLIALANWYNTNINPPDVIDYVNAIDRM